MSVTIMDGEQVYCRKMDGGKFGVTEKGLLLIFLISKNKDILDGAGVEELQKAP